ncbi:MAG: amino acid adenylation domain-containing protein [Ilumatobacter sp.]
MTSICVLADLLDRQRIEPGAPALSDGTDALSYGEFADAVATVADLLVQLQVQPGDRVGVHQLKSVWSFVAVHAVLRAGAVMVPIDPLAPVEHAVAVIADARIEVLLTDTRQSTFDALVGADAGLRAAVVRRDLTADDVAIMPWPSLAASAPSTDPVLRQPDDDAYIIYTSGSTGQPKGIVHTHRSALAYARIAAAEYGLRADDRLVNIASLHFDQSTFELYAAPLVGAAVTVAPDAVMRFPASLSELVANERATVWYSVPYVLRQLVTRGALDDRDLTSLRWILYGGESYPVDELADLMAALPDATVSNVYGPAEVNQCTRFDIAEMPAAGGVVPIGAAWPETEVVVVDESGESAEQGPGELWVATSTMMDRYWNRPDLTAAAVVDRSFDDARATRWYRTGDLVDTDPDGALVFLGRADNQVKIRGQRVELEAIDQTVRELHEVHEVSMVVDVDEAGERGLVAVVELEPGSELTLRHVQRAVAASHQRVAVPVAVVIVASLQRTGTGKVDRNAALRESRAAREG